MENKTVKYRYVSPMARNAMRYKRSKREGTFRFGCNEVTNNFIAAIFANEESKGSILTISSRGNTSLPEFCVIDSHELLAKLDTINHDVIHSGCFVSIELRN